MVTNGPETTYNGVQLILNKRMSNGWQLQTNYSFGKGYQYDFYSLRVPYLKREQTHTNGNASLGNIRHSFQANWVLDLPFGQGRRFGSNANGFVNRIIGGWSWMGTARLQTGRLVDFGNVRLVGFTKDELQDMYKLRMTTDPNNKFRTLVWILPEDIVQNTMKAFNINATGYAGEAPSGRYFAPANGPSCLETAVSSYTSSTAGYGACGEGSVVVQGPMVARFDMTFSKQVPIVKSVRGEFQLQVYNVFNRVNFNPMNYVGTVQQSYEVTSAVDQARTMQMSFRLYF
jgi:hypothetical protein